MTMHFWWVESGYDNSKSKSPEKSKRLIKEVMMNVWHRTCNSRDNNTVAVWKCRIFFSGFFSPCGPVSFLNLMTCSLIPRGMCSAVFFSDFIYLLPSDIKKRELHTNISGANHTPVILEVPAIPRLLLELQLAFTNWANPKSSSVLKQEPAQVFSLGRAEGEREIRRGTADPQDGCLTKILQTAVTLSVL